MLFEMLTESKDEQTSVQVTSQVKQARTQSQLNNSDVNVSRSRCKVNHTVDCRNNLSLERYSFLLKNALFFCFRSGFKNMQIRVYQWIDSQFCFSSLKTTNISPVKTT